MARTTRNPVSFVSEHTAEYVLIPKLLDAFAQRGLTAVPLYYSAHREGSRLSREKGPTFPVRILCCFARRPKQVDTTGQSIGVKLNRELFVTSRAAATAGIPTFAGVPLVGSIVDLQRHAPCRFLHLGTFLPEAAPVIQFEFNRLTDEWGMAEPSALPDGVRIVSVDRVVQVALRSSRPHVWDDALGHLDAIRCAVRDSSFDVPADRNSRFLFFGGPYKPFYVLVLDPREPKRMALPAGDACQ